MFFTSSRRKSNNFDHWFPLAAAMAASIELSVHHSISVFQGLCVY